jgi:hypothetical protein
MMRIADDGKWRYKYKEDICELQSMAMCKGKKEVDGKVNCVSNGECDRE